MTWAFRTWLAWAEPFGLGELALLPDQFWRLTPREFRVCEAGFERREDRALEKVAMLGLWMIAPYTKKKFTPRELLGLKRPLVTRPPRPGTADAEAEAALAQARALAQALAWAKG